MEYSFSDEQQQFRGVVQRFMRDKSPMTEVRRLMATKDGFDRDLWMQSCDDLGLAGLHVPEAYGGSGFGFVEVGIVAEEMGRSLLCSPYFGSSILATSVILHAGSEEQKRDLLPDLIVGKTVACLAFAEASGHWNSDGVELTALQSGKDVLLNGKKKFVLDGCAADVIIVVARRPGTHGREGIGLYITEGMSTGLGRRSLDTIDETRKLAELSFDGVRAQVLNDSEGVVAAIGHALDDGAIALANEMVGGAQALLDSTVEYTKLRMQFGRVIGSFQAVKHKCAEILLDVELAKSAAYYAAEARAENHPDVSMLASLAKATAADAYMRTAIEAIQLHGGIGFTWDHDTHLWYKRAKSSEVLLDDPTYHRNRYMAFQEVLHELK